MQTQTFCVFTKTLTHRTPSSLPFEVSTSCPDCSALAPWLLRAPVWRFSPRRTGCPAGLLGLLCRLQLHPAAPPQGARDSHLCTPGDAARTRRVCPWHPPAILQPLEDLEVRPLTLPLTALQPPAEPNPHPLAWAAQVTVTLGSARLVSFSESTQVTTIAGEGQVQSVAPTWTTSIQHSQE